MKCFVSREEKDWQPIAAACSPMDVQWICQSLIHKSTVDFDLPERSFDWVFFSSQEAVHAFFDRQKPQNHLRYGAIGEGTARALSKHTTPAFIGLNNNTEQTAESFRKIAGTGAVLFPVSDISLRTVQSHLPPAQVIDVVVYRTQLRIIPIPICDLYIFSSPSNVVAFFGTNTIPQQSKAMAFGAKTAQKLSEFTDQSALVLDQLDANSIATAIKQIFLR